MRTYHKRADFERRVLEIQVLLRHLRREEKVDTQGIHLPILRASALLLMYNLVESSARSLSEAVFEDAEGQALRIDGLRIELQQHLMKTLSRFGRGDQNHPKAVRAVASGGATIYSELYDAHEALAGNVDRLVLEGILKKLGCPGHLPPDPTLFIASVKAARNDLAHGHLSFNDLGRNLVFRDMLVGYIALKSNLRHAFDEVDALSLT